MKAGYKHKSFCVFYPSDLFEIDVSKQKRIKEVETSNSSLKELNELKALYTEHLNSISNEEIASKCEYAKIVLNTSLKDVDAFSANSQKTASELIPLISLFTAVMALAISVFGNNVVVPFFVIFGCIAVIGTCKIYINSTNLRVKNSQLNEEYRKSLMCFETVEKMVKER